MSSSTEIRNIVVALAIVMLVVSLVIPGNTAWSSLQTTLETGPSFPSFSTQYIAQLAPPGPASNTGVVNIGSVKNGWPTYHPSGGNVHNAGGVANCTGSSDYWGCWRTADGAWSYITIPVGGQVGVNLSANFGGADNAQMQWLELHYECRAVTSAAIQVVFLNSVGSAIWFFSPSSPCMPGAFVNYTYHNQVTSNRTVSYISGIMFGVYGAPASVDIGFVSVDVGYNTAATCGGWDVPCAITNLFRQIGAFFQPVAGFFVGAINLGISVANGLIWLLLVLYSIVSFLVGVLAGVIVGLLSSLVWLMAIPGCPPIVQGIIDIPILGSLAVLFVFIISAIRGGGPGA